MMEHQITKLQNNIPDELQQNGKFCLVKSNDKIPYICDALNYTRAKPNNPADFADFKTAISALKDSDFLGGTDFKSIGLSVGNGFGFLDFDHCIDSKGNIDSRVQSIIKQFNSYTEYSTSKTGIHIYIKCPGFLKKFTKESFKKRFKFRSDFVECYLSGLTSRYGIMTGNQYPGTPKTINDVSDLMESFLNEHLSRNQPKKKSVKKQDVLIGSSESDSEIIEWLKNKSRKNLKFRKLFDSGDITGFPSASEADIALANLIAWRCGNKPEQIKRIMWKSALVRDGKNEKTLSFHEPDKWMRSGYLDNTIQDAINFQNGNFYDRNYYLSEPKKKESKPILNFLTGSQTEIKPVEWLWHPYIPKGAVTLLSASPGSGKTFFATWISACVTSGIGFPESSELDNIKTKRVIYLSLEDDYSRTIIPRLKVNGGNLDNFFYLPTEEMPESFSDPKIVQMLNAIHPDLIIFDALSSFIGNVNVNYFNDVRKALSPLLRAIEETDTAVLLIAHNNKMSSVTNAMERVSGSVDFTAFIRSGLSIGKNPKDEEEIIMAQFKNNLYNIGSSMAFEYGYPENSSEIPSFNFKSLSSLTADELLGGSRRPSPKLDNTKTALLQILEESGGTAKAKDIKEKLHQKGYSDSTINRAKKDLGIKHKGIREGTGRENTTYWSLDEFE